MGYLKQVILPVALLLNFALQVSAERDTIDRIVAVVGDQVVLASELASQIQLAAIQTGKKFSSEEEVSKFRDEILESMISDHLFLIAAREDTMLSVRSDEIDRALDEHIERVSGQYASDEAFLQALAEESLTLRDLRKRLRPDVENQLLKQRFMQRKLSNIPISRHEAEEFFYKYSDSIPAQPEAAKLAHILLEIAPSEKVDDSVKQLATIVRQKILDGADFAAMSAQYSSMDAGRNGGDLGFVSKSDVVPEFARAAFNLGVGDISGVIRTQFGYHIIKCDDVNGDRLRLRHVLFGVLPMKEDTVRVVRFIDSLLTLVREGADFAELAKEYSNDNSSRALGGELGWFAVNQLPSEFAMVVAGWQTPGEFRGPVYSKNGIHILRLLEYNPEKKLNLEEDFDEIKGLARQTKIGRLAEDWVTELKSQTYIEYRLDNQ